MANIVRCKLPDGVKRFKPFSVKEYRDLLLIRSDLDNHSHEEKVQMLDEHLEDYFPEVPKEFRGYCFVKVFTASIGKTLVPVIYTCKECGKEHKIHFNLDLKPLEYPIIELGSLKIKFKFGAEKDITSLIVNNIDSVEQNNIVYDWNDISEEQRLLIAKSITVESIENVIKQLYPIYVEVSTKCSCGHVTTSVITDFLRIFEILMHSDEIFHFYQINHALTKNKYSLSEVMEMMPIERSIVLSLVEKDLKQ